MAENDTLMGSYYLYACGINESGNVFFGTSTGYILGSVLPTGIKNGNGTAIPDKFSLNQNYPNPFNPHHHHRI